MPLKLEQPMGYARTLTHPSGVSVQTPLLVPSISSKGLGENEAGESEAAVLLAVAQEFVTDAILISAYDISHSKVPAIDQPFTDLVFLDSGGYEVSQVQDLSATYFEKGGEEPWSREQYRGVLSSWPEHVPTVFVSYDHPDSRIPLSEQTAAAHEDLSSYTDQWRCVLVKPSTKRQKYVKLSEIEAAVPELVQFDIVGFTEKELGNSLMDRMTALARIRAWLDDATDGQAPPIHVFGALDPQTVVLLFMAGAEVFDGLTWLRYGYSNGVAVYYQNHGARKYGVRERTDSIKLRTLTENYHYLRTLEDKLRIFRLDYDWSRWGPDAPFFKDAWETLRGRID